MNTSSSALAGIHSTEVTEDPWVELREFTDARIALGRCGTSLPLASVLALRLAHAQARDAVHTPLELASLTKELSALQLNPLVLQSAATDRAHYLTRPDLGRQLAPSSHQLLVAQAQASGCDLALVIGDGLSSRAIMENALPFIQEFTHHCAVSTNLRLGPICLVENCRVATGDEIGSLLGARLVVVLIGERPGLSSPNSMGIYLTYGPRPGLQDEARNCLSNIREGGLAINQGVRKLTYLIEEALALGASGVQLKDRMPPNYLPFQQLKKLARQ